MTSPQTLTLSTRGTTGTKGRVSIAGLAHAKLTNQPIVVGQDDPPDWGAIRPEGKPLATIVIDAQYLRLLADAADDMTGVTVGAPVQLTVWGANKPMGFALLKGRDRGRGYDELMTGFVMPMVMGATDE